MDGLFEFVRRLLGLADSRQLVTVELRFGTDLSRAAVEALLGAVAGLPRQAAIAFETLVTEDGIRHLLRSDQETVDTVCAQLRGLVPSTRIEPRPTVPPTAWRMGVRLSWSRRQPLLRVDGTAEAAVGLLAALGPLARHEALLVQIALRPGRPVSLPPSDRDGGGKGVFGAASVETHVLSGIRAKNSGPLLRSRVLLAVACGHPGRGAHLLGRIVSVFRSRRGSHGSLTIRRLGARGITDVLRRPPRGGDLLSPTELAGLPRLADQRATDPRAHARHQPATRTRPADPIDRSSARHLYLARSARASARSERSRGHRSRARRRAEWRGQVDPTRGCCQC